MRHLMSKNFSAPRSAPNPASVTNDVPQGQSGPGGDERVAAVGDVGERPAVDEGRSAAQRLHQVGVDGLLEEQRHGAGGVEVGGPDGLSLTGGGHDDVAEPGGQIL